MYYTESHNVRWTQSKRAYYLKSNATCCPDCQSNNLMADPIDKFPAEKVICRACAATWTDTYEDYRTWPCKTRRLFIIGRLAREIYPPFMKRVLMDTKSVVSLVVSYLGYYRYIRYNSILQRILSEFSPRGLTGIWKKCKPHSEQEFLRFCPLSFLPLILNEVSSDNLKIVEGRLKKGNIGRVIKLEELNGYLY